MVTMLKPRLQQAPAKMTSTPARQRLRGSAWVTIRTRIMKRDAGLCQPCDRAGLLTAAAEVDHITPVHKGGSDDDVNLEAICLDCHKAKSDREDRERRGLG